jgi:hypothetical protein
VFYVEGGYAEPPFCTECGMDKAVNCLGFEEFISAGVEE